MTAQAWLDYMAANRRANTEYRAHPITTRPYCLNCGRPSNTPRCNRRKCA